MAKKKKYTGPSEYQIQCSVFEWAKIMSPFHPELRLLNSSLNGVRLNIGQAIKAKKAGMKKGFPDIQLPVPKGKYSGLFIELKTDAGRPSTEQKHWILSLEKYGNFACVCKGYDATVDIILKYLQEKI